VDDLIINDRITIPVSELEISFSRSSGPGGQHVNKTSSQAELVFDLANSTAFTPEDRGWLLERLRHRLDTSGRLRLTSQESRSQRQNKGHVIEKLREILIHALRRPKVRKPTKPSRASVHRRLDSKKKHGETKKLRRKDW
jgi:ribosome-associated protein